LIARIFQRIINQMTLSPKMLFLIDGMGALLSAFLLGVILTRFESTFGMPRKSLYFLSFLPIIFAIYDFSCYLRIRKYWKSFLKIIAIARGIYCCISIGFVIHHFQELTNLGFIYFLLEFTIVIILASVELKTAARLTKNTVQ